MCSPKDKYSISPSESKGSPSPFPAILPLEKLEEGQGQDQANCSQLIFNTRNFLSSELVVRSDSDNGRRYLLIEAEQQEEGEESLGLSFSFRRKYKLPRFTDLDKILCTLDDEDKLIITIPKERKDQEDNSQRTEEMKDKLFHIKHNASRLDRSRTRIRSGLMFEEDKATVGLHLSSPHFSPSEIEATITSNPPTILITGQHQTKLDPDDQEEVFEEECFFSRSYTLPEDANPDQFNCEFDDKGNIILTVEMRKPLIPPLISGGCDLFNKMIYNFQTCQCFYQRQFADDDDDDIPFRKRSDSEKFGKSK